MSPAGFTPSDLVSRASADPVPFVLMALCTAWYLRSVGRLRARGGAWPAGRTAAFVYGQVALLLALQSGLGAMGRTDFTAAATRVILSSMIAPVMLVAGAPLTLVAVGGRPRSRRVLASVLGWPGWRWAAGPFVTWPLWGGSLLALYFSGLYPHVAGGGWALAVQVWLLATGLLWWWAMFGAEPVPRHPSYWERLVSLLAGLAFFTILGMALESQTTPINPGTGLGDLHLGAGLIWIFGTSVELLGALAVFVLWLRADERRAKERDALEGAAAERQLALWRAARQAGHREAQAGHREAQAGHREAQAGAPR